MSWVFLTPRHAYKLKKPVRSDSFDFSTIEARRNDGLEEVRLNRRLAPHVYLGIVPLVVSGSGEPRLEQTGEAVDWLIKMRRLPADRMLDVLIRQRRLSSHEVERVGEVLSAFYASAPAIDMTGTRYRARLNNRIRSCHEAIREPAYGLAPRALDAIRDTLERFIERNATLFDSRVRRVVEGHGDLRPEHICIERRPVIFDCLEFNREYRILDAADELAFLDMECARLGMADVGSSILRVYAQMTGDRPPESLLWFYQASSACVRAMLAVWHLRDVDQARHRHWLDHAGRYIAFAAARTRRLEG